MLIKFNISYSSQQMTPLQIILCAILGLVACSFEKDRLSQKEYNAIVDYLVSMKMTVSRLEIERVRKDWIAQAWEHRPEIVSSYQHSTELESWFLGDWEDRSIASATPIDKFDNETWNVVIWEERPTVLTASKDRFEEKYIDIYKDRPVVVATYQDDFSNEFASEHNEVDDCGHAFNSSNFGVVMKVTYNHIKAKIDKWWEEVRPQIKDALKISIYKMKINNMGVMKDCIVIFSLDLCSPLHVFYICMGMLVFIE
jgi:hypothetical protein